MELPRIDQKKKIMFNFPNKNTKLKKKNKTFKIKVGGKCFATCFINSLYVSAIDGE